MQRGPVTYAEGGNGQTGRVPLVDYDFDREVRRRQFCLARCHLQAIEQAG